MLSDEEIRERKAHQDMIEDIKAVLSTKSGKSFVRYLFDSFEVGSLPRAGMDGNLLIEHLGFLRAGESVFAIISQASPEIAGQILAGIVKERYARTIPE